MDILGFTLPTAAAAIDRTRAEFATYESAAGVGPGESDAGSFEEWLLRAADEAVGGLSTVPDPEPPEWVWALDERMIVRPLLERVPDDLPVVLSLEEVVSRGFVRITETECDDARSEAPIGAGHAPLVVMTEGSTDAFVLDEAIRVLRPDLVGFVRTLDHSARARGGAGALVNALKSFIAAGISNRIVCLFDNDSAAKDALRSLDYVRMPKNFAVRRLPTLELAKAYPTSGPSGDASMDVNGSAVSIEMFLGTDCLTVDDRLTPVRWSGLIDGVGQYQGELVDKRAVMDSFRVKAKNSAPGALSGDWTDLRDLLEDILGTFT